MSKKRTHTVHVYGSYRFRNKDPIIDRVRTIFQDENVSQDKVHEMGGVTSNTLTAWFKGDTMRPQFASIAATVRCLGYDIAFVRGVGKTADSIGKIVNLNSYRHAKRTPGRANHSPLGARRSTNLVAAE